MILVGTHHYDLVGPRRLEHVLEVFRPRSITVEMAMTMDEFRESIKISESMEKMDRETLDAIADRASIPKEANYRILFRDFLKVTGYEVWIPASYADRTGASVDFVDSPVSKGIMKNIPGITYDQFTTLSILQQIPEEALNAGSHEDARRIIQAETDARYHGDKDVFKKQTGRTTGALRMLGLSNEKIDELMKMDLPDSLLDERDSHMAERINALCPDMHIGGFKHFYYRGNDAGLHRLLEGDVKRMLLCDAYALNP